MKKSILFYFLLLFSLINLQGQDMCAPVGWATQNGGTTGGGNATPTIVSNYNDLKTAITSASVKVVHISGTITIPSGGRISFQDQSGKTLYGLPGAKLVSNDLSSGSSGILSVKRCNNIIIRNIIFEGPAAYDVDGSDNIVLDNCVNVWVDHCEFQDGLDGNLDIKNASDFISVTWCKFIYNKAPIPDGPGGSDDHRFSNLFGSSDSDTQDRNKMRITLQNCWWAQGCKARMPRVRFGKVHVVNNYFSSTVASSCVMAGFEADLLVESNVFENVNNPIDKMSNNFTAITQRNNIFTGTSGNTTGSGTSFTPPYTLTIAPAANVKAQVTAAAGATLTSPDCSGGGNNQLPAVSITAPANGTSYTAPASINLTASASDADGSVSQVQFYNGTTLLHTDASAPYTYSWTNVPVGTFTLTAKATDNDGGEASSASVTVSVYSGTGIAIQAENYCNADGIEESEHAGYNGTGFLNLANATGSFATYAVNATASLNADLTIRYASGSSNNRNMSLMVNGVTQIASIDFLPTGAWTTWNTVTVQVSLSGGHNLITLTSLMAEGAPNLDELFWGSASVSNGNCAGSANQSPSASLTSPSDGAGFASPATITFDASASDPDGTISNVEFLNGTVVIGSDATAPYSLNWTGVGAGTYDISVRATDNFGASFTTTAITITVSGPANLVPVVAITSPANGSSFAEPSPILIEADASDADGSISKVQFYKDGNLLSEDLTSPYSYDWTNVTPGTYTLTAVAIDNQSGQTTSAAISVTVTANQASVITLTSPTEGSTVNGLSVMISGTASDPDGGVSLVQVYNGATLIGSSTSSPFDIPWNNPGDGTYTITIKVTDSNGGVTSTDRTFTLQSSVTGIFTSSTRTFVSVYPNPSRDQFHITSEYGIKKLKIATVHGAVVEELLDIPANQILEIGSGLEEGAYILLIEYESGLLEVGKLFRIK